MIEKTERTIRNGQSRDTGNIGHTRHRTKTKTYKDGQNGPLNNRWLKDNQYLSRKRHMQCYSHS